MKKKDRIRLMIKKIYGFELGDKYNSYRFRNFDMNFIYHALSEVYIESEPGLNNGFVESGPTSLYRIPGLYTVVRDEFIISEEKEIIDKYIEIFKTGYKEPDEITGYMLPKFWGINEYMAGSIPSPRIQSEIYLFRKEPLPGRNIIIPERPVYFYKTSFILPGSLKNYNYVYKQPGTTYFRGIDYIEFK